VRAVVLLATVVDWDALVEVIWVSFVAGIGVTAAWAASILGAARWLDFGRNGRTGEAAVFGLLALLGAGVVLAAVVFGVVVMTQK
jgi:hypothetical protein